MNIRGLLTLDQLMSLEMLVQPGTNTVKGCLFFLKRGQI